MIPILGKFIDITVLPYYLLLFAGIFYYVSIKILFSKKRSTLNKKKTRKRL